MHHKPADAHESLKSSRFLTGAILLAGFLLLAMGIGLAVQQPGIALIIAAGVWLAVIALIRVQRGL